MEEKKVEKKAVISYTVTRYEDGSVDVADTMDEATQRVTAEECYKDVEDVAKMVANKRIENAAFVGAYQGTAKFYQDVNARQAEEAEETAE